MGRLVKTTPAAQERQEEKRTVVGTGANGRLVKVESSASKPSAMPAQGSTSPMLRQQNPDTRTSYQKALDEAMMKRAAADRKNRERGRRSSSRSHAQEVRGITGEKTKKSFIKRIFPFSFLHSTNGAVLRLILNLLRHL